MTLRTGIDSELQPHVCGFIPTRRELLSAAKLEKRRKISEATENTCAAAVLVVPAYAERVLETFRVD